MATHNEHAAATILTMGGATSLYFMVSILIIFSTDQTFHVTVMAIFVKCYMTSIMKILLFKYKNSVFHNHTTC